MHFHISLSLLDQNITLHFLPWKFFNFESEAEENYKFRYLNFRLDGNMKFPDLSSNSEW
jgi:hypothetical protein